jgi:hypothetical protein
MRGETKTFIGITSAISAVFAVLLFVSIHDRYGVWKTLLFCLAGVGAIWLFSYLRARLFGWIGPRRAKDKETGKQIPG